MVPRARSTVLILAALAVLAPPGCTIYRGEFDALSSRELDLAGLDPVEAPGEARESRVTSGQSEREIYFLFPDRDDFPTLAEAIENALEEGRGDLILNARVERWHWYIPLMYGSSGWKVVGEVVSTGSRAARAQSEEQRTGRADLTAD